jgi:hypothetical protein
MTAGGAAQNTPPYQQSPLMTPQPLQTIADDAGRNILIVDASHSIRHLLCTVLRDRGYHCVEADGAFAAHAAFSSAPHTIDLLITDVRLPDTCGQALARSLLAFRPAMRVIVISGASYHVPLDRGWRFLPKPFVMRDLLNSVTELIGEPEIRVKAAAG